jgi:hypothetical protein
MILLSAFDDLNSLTADYQMKERALKPCQVRLASKGLEAGMRSTAQMSLVQKAFGRHGERCDTLGDDAGSMNGQDRGLESSSQRGGMYRSKAWGERERGCIDETNALGSLQQTWEGRSREVRNV